MIFAPTDYVAITKQEWQQIIGPETYKKYPQVMRVFLHGCAADLAECVFLEAQAVHTRTSELKNEDAISVMLLILACRARLTKFHYWHDLNQWNSFLDSPLQNLNYNTWKARFEKADIGLGPQHKMYSNQKIVTRMLRFCEIFIPLIFLSRSGHQPRIGCFEMPKIIQNFQFIREKCSGYHFRWLSDVGDNYADGRKIFRNFDLNFTDVVNNAFVDRFPSAKIILSLG